MKTSPSSEQETKSNKGTQKHTLLTEKKSAFNEKDLEKMTPDELIDWFSKNYHCVCSDVLYGRIEGLHRITEADFFEMAIGFWRTKEEIDYQPMLWTAISKLFKDTDCYNIYLTFEYEQTTRTVSDIKMKTIPKFTTEYPCYSIPLFRSILKNIKPDKDDSFLFTKGIAANDRISIIFKIKTNTGIYYYDITDNPRIQKI